MIDDNSNTTTDNSNDDDDTFEWMDLAGDLIDLTNITVAIIVCLLLRWIEHFNKRPNDSNSDSEGIDASKKNNWPV